MSTISLKKLDQLCSYYEIDSHEDLITAATKLLYCIHVLDLENYDMSFVKLKKDKNGELIEPADLETKDKKANLIYFDVRETLQGYTNKSFE